MGFRQRQAAPTSIGDATSSCLLLLLIYLEAVSLELQLLVHRALYKYWFSHPFGHHTRPGHRERGRRTISLGVEDPGYVKGLENPNEFVNIVRWMIKHGYSDPEIAKVVGQNVTKMLEKGW